MSNLGLALVIVGAVILAVTVLCIVAYVALTIMELIEKFIKKYFPQKYYYDYEEEV